MLDEYALGQLSQDEQRDVETHVRECDVCAADLREFCRNTFVVSDYDGLVR